MSVCCSSTLQYQSVFWRNLEDHSSSLHTMETLNFLDVSNINEIAKLFVLW